MSTPCNCAGFSEAEKPAEEKVTAAAAPAAGAPTECPAIVHETVCVQAEVTITPAVTVGEIESFCVGGPVIGSCPGTPSPTNSCTFTVSQNICVQVPLTFSANATAEPTGLVCGTPATGACPA